MPEVRQNVNKGLKSNDGGEYSISLYSDELVSPISLAIGIKQLQIAFPKMDKDFFDLLASRIISNDFSEKRLKDAVNYVLDNFQYKELNISDIVKFDRRVKLLTYGEVCKMWMNGVPNTDFEIRDIDGTKYWVRKVDLLNAK
jgi:hypothetical protein